MSWRALGYVWELKKHEDGSPLSRLERDILLCLAYNHDAESHFAYCGVKAIADFALCSRRGAFKALQRCEVHKTITISRHSDTRGLKLTNQYHFNAMQKRDGLHNSNIREGNSIESTDNCGFRPIFARGSAPGALPRAPGALGGSAPGAPLPMSLLSKPRSNPAAKPVAAVSPHPDEKTEQENRRKIEARDRREKLESAGVARERTAGAGEIKVGLLDPTRPVMCNFCFERFAPDVFAVHECDQSTVFLEKNAARTEQKT